MNRIPTRALPSTACPWHLLGHRYFALGSTMTEAQKLAADGAPHGTWVLADAQTAGRGRLGRRWQSEAHAGVYWTLILRPQAKNSVQGLSLVFGMAALDAVSSVLQAAGLAFRALSLGLKWPNDIVYQGRKLGGILMEAEGLGGPQPVLRVGIGINVKAARNVALAPDVAPRYIGLMELTEPRPKAQAAAPNTAETWAEALVFALVRHCHASYARFCTQGLGACLEGFEARDALRGRRVTACVGGALLTGLADGIGPSGHLRLKLEDTSVWVDSGEVSEACSAAPDGPQATNLTQGAAAVYVGLTPEAQ